MKKQQKNKKSGFTLVELVVVIAIIGVLAAVITPRVRNALVKAKDAKAVATLDGLRTAINVYHAETGEVLGTGSGFLTMENIETLKTAKYLDSTGGLKGDSADGKEGEVIIEAGTMFDASTCLASDKVETPQLKIYMVDGTSLIFAGEDAEINSDGELDQDLETMYDTSCKLWKDK